ncbi:MAG TPA: Gfo/Idh/MocA family oxidoreductase, partial [Polyangia bacterium]|nr:Gfo/Idh/MocA family oxidoreductase [Polyangia bacterium]
MLRFGILGASRFALKRMLPAMRLVPEVEVVAIASRDGGKAAEAARAHGIARAHPSYEALLADREVDAVYNPLPNHLHVPWSERAAAAGKHVLCEKPIATTAAEARRLLGARDRAGVVICEAAMVRLHPRWLAARELLRGGRIGELRAFSGSFGYGLASRTDIRYEAAMGGGVLYDTGFYPVTMSRFCFEAEPVAVLARAALSGPDGVDVLSSAVLEFPRGQATLTCGMELAPTQRALLIGTKGHLDLPFAWTPAADRPAELTVETSPTLERPNAERRTFEAVDQYALLVAAFARTAAAAGP